MVGVPGSSSGDGWIGTGQERKDGKMDCHSPTLRENHVLTRYLSGGYPTNVGKTTVFLGGRRGRRKDSLHN